MGDVPDDMLNQVFQDALALSAQTGKSFEEVVTIMTAGAPATRRIPCSIIFRVTLLCLSTKAI